MHNTFIIHISLENYNSKARAGNEKMVVPGRGLVAGSSYRHEKGLQIKCICILSATLSYASWMGFAKMMRPAAVWRAEVTSTVMVSFM